jgi:uncharacterized protein YjbI with pentapeptide repeats
MDRDKALRLLKGGPDGVAEWNRHRSKNPDERVVLSEADLNKADLRGANLGLADLGGADLRGARNLNQRQLDSAWGNAATKLPEGLVRPACWGDAAAP